MKEGKTKTRHESTLYLQPKAELDAHEMGRDELEAVDRACELEQGARYEIDGNGGQAELVGFSGDAGMLHSLTERHELRGEEHSAELHGDVIEDC